MSKKPVQIKPEGPYTTGQLAPLFHVSVRTFNKWVDAGVIVGYRLPLCRDRRVTRAAILTYLDSNPEIPRPALFDQTIEGGC